MKYPIILVAVATLMLLVGVGIRIHADSKYTNKMFYHTIDSTLYTYEEVFAEKKIGDMMQFWSVVAGGVGGVWFVVLNIRRDRSGR